MKARTSSAASMHKLGLTEMNRELHEQQEENSPVICKRLKSMMSIVLDRPEKLNSLNLEMIRIISTCLQEALEDETCRFILFYGSGDRGFCAAGDVIELMQNVKKKDYAQALSFFTAEYSLDLMISDYAKPVIVIADGITLGGGLGIAAGADIVIATERSRMGMPETKIGFFPDIGATGWMFAKCPRGYPEYLGLTGYDMQAKECVRLGLATNFMNSARLPELIKLLEEYEPVEVREKELLLSEIRKQLAYLFDFNIPQKPDMDAWVQQYFSGKTDLKEILTSLSHCTLQEKLCDDVFTNIKERSPTALVLNLKLLRHNEGRPLPEVFAAELKAAQYIIRHPDYAEGVRARLLDKDHLPCWNPDKISEVDLTDLDLA
jgi:enoyl-CoA hydratase